MRDLSTFNSCRYGHPLEWHEGIQDFICPTCEYAVSHWLTQLIEKTKKVNPNPTPVIEGPGYVMVGKSYDPPIREHPARYVLLGILGALTVLLLAAIAAYFSLLPISSL